MTETIDLESLVPYIVVTGIHWESFVVPETPFLEVLFIMLECLLGLGVDPAIKNTHTHMCHVPFRAPSTPPGDRRLCFTSSTPVPPTRSMSRTTFEHPGDPHNDGGD